MEGRNRVAGMMPEKSEEVQRMHDVMPLALRIEDFFAKFHADNALSCWSVAVCAISRALAIFRPLGVTW